MTRLVGFAFLLGVFSLPISLLDAATFYDLRDNTVLEPLDGSPTFDLTEDGITVTLLANIGDLNSTASGFGINAPGAGDDTDALDDVNGTESITMTFDTIVRFTQIQLLRLSAGEAANLEIVIGGSSFALTDTGAGTDIFNFANQTVLVGESVVLTHVSGNGFSFENFTVARIPEPASLGMSMMAIMAIVACGRQRRRR